MLIQCQNKTDTCKFWGYVKYQEINGEHHVIVHSKETGWITVGKYSSRETASNICNEIVKSYINRNKKIYYCPSDIA